MKNNYAQVSEVVIALVDNNALKATKYISSTRIVRAVRKTFKFNGRKPLKNANIEVILTIGKPNYIEREFIKACQKAGEPFPVKKVQLKFPTQRSSLTSKHVKK